MHIKICFFIFSMVIFSDTLFAQQLKIGVFDSDVMVQILPEYRSAVDSVLERFATDTLQAEYSFYRQEYNQLDSAYKRDSLLNKAKTILNLKRKQRDELAVTLMNWERIAEYRIQQKRAVLAVAFYDKVMTAYKRVVAREKYNLVLKPNTYEAFTTIDNVFAHVAKELNIKLPKELSME